MASRWENWSSSGDEDNDWHGHHTSNPCFHDSQTREAEFTAFSPPSAHSTYVQASFPAVEIPFASSDLLLTSPGISSCCTDTATSLTSALPWTLITRPLPTPISSSSTRPTPQPDHNTPPPPPASSSDISTTTTITSSLSPTPSIPSCSSRTSNSTPAPTLTSNVPYPSSINLPSLTPPSTPHPSTPISEHAAPNTILSHLSTDAKIGSLLGIVMFLLIVAVLAMKFCGTGEGRYARVNWEAQYREEMVEEGEGEGLDSEGIKWPEKVVLRGEAREVREWTVAYGRLAGEEFDKGRMAE